MSWRRVALSSPGLLSRLPGAWRLAGAWRWLSGAWTRRSSKRAKVRRDLLFLAAGLPPHLAAAALAAWFAWLVVRLPAAAVVPVIIMVAGTGALTAAQRWRYAELLGIRLPRPPAVGGPLDASWALRWLRSPDSWRQLGYHAVAALVLGALELIVLGLGVGGVVATTVYAWSWEFPTAGIAYATDAVLLTVGGPVLVAAAIWLARPVAATEARVARALLGPGRASQLQRRVADLAESRAGVLDAADAERRRIERDLHDGAQQRLVSLAVNLGLAKATLSDLPQDARQVIEEAHREAKEAIAELGNLVRGLHPPVLEDRGLDAALSGLVARAPLPVRLRVRLDRRPAPAVEAVAYFVVSEALTNITKHAQATRAEVSVERIGEVLRVTVTDDGIGGADSASADRGSADRSGGGSGLDGLAKRAASVDGKLRISSPAGGPTVITAELPCEP